MDQLPFFIFMAGIVGVITALSVGRSVLRRRRAARAKDFAQERGWGYEPVNDLVLEGYPQVYPFYSQGRSTSKPGLSIGGNNRSDSARDVLRFMVGDYPSESFTYTYVTYDSGSDGGSSAQHSYWHVLGLELPVPFPHLTIRRNRKFKIGARSLPERVDFPDPALTAAYAIHCEYPAAAFDLITPATAQWLVAEEFQDEMVLHDNRLFVFRKGKQDLERLDAMIGMLTGFLSRIPAEAWRKAQGEYPRPQRIVMYDAFNLNVIKDAYQQWKDSK